MCSGFDPGGGKTWKAFVEQQDVTGDVQQDRHTKQNRKQDRKNLSSVCVIF